MLCYGTPFRLGVICASIWRSFQVGDHFWSGIIFCSGIICGPGITRGVVLDVDQAKFTLSVPTDLWDRYNFLITTGNM